MDKRYLYRRNWKTGEIDGLVDVTGKSERQIERIEYGMIRNLHDDWVVYDSAVDALPSPPQEPQP